MSCQFCESDEETVLCDWPELKPTPKPISLAEVGDVWVTHQKQHKARIVQIEEDPMMLGLLRVRIWIEMPKRPGPYPCDRFRNDTFTTLSPGTCDRQACWRHFREVGENKHYCKDHWDSWLSVRHNES